jgi:hypothetical protein
MFSLYVTIGRALAFRKYIPPLSNIDNRRVVRPRENRAVAYKRRVKRGSSKILADCLTEQHTSHLQPMQNRKDKMFKLSDSETRLTLLTLRPSPRSKNSLPFKRGEADFETSSHDSSLFFLFRYIFILFLKLLSKTWRRRDQNADGKKKGAAPASGLACGVLES